MDSSGRIMSMLSAHKGTVLRWIVPSLTILIAAVAVIFWMYPKNHESQNPPVYKLQNRSINPQDSPEYFYLNSESLQNLLPTHQIDKSTQYIPYYYYTENDIHYVLFKSQNGIQRYIFSANDLVVDLEEFTDSQSWEPRVKSKPIFQIKNGENWEDVLVDGVRIEIDDANKERLLLKQKFSEGEIDWIFGIEGKEVELKNTFKYFPKQAGVARMVWQVNLTEENMVFKELKSEDIKFAESEKVFVDWSDFTEQTKSILTENKDALNIYFYEDGKSGDLEIDPTISATVVGNYYQIYDGTRWWCFGPGYDSGTSQEFFQPGRIYHSSSGAPTNCATGGDNLLPGDRSGSQASYDQWVDPSGAIASGATNVLNLLESTNTRSVLQVSRNTTDDSYSKYVVYPNGYNFITYEIGTATNATTPGYFIHYDASNSAPQVANYDTTNRVFVFSDTSNNNYAGMVGVGFRPLDVMYTNAFDSNTSADYYGWYGNDGNNQITTLQSFNYLFDMSNYRATTTTRDDKRNEYRTPDDLRDGLQNVTLWDQIGEQNRFFYSAFESADTNLCNGGDGFSTGSCSGTETFVGNSTSNVFLGTYSARVVGDASGTDSSYTRYNLPTNQRSRRQNYRFTFNVNSETLANGQNFGIFRINEVTGTDGYIYVDQSAGNLRLCIEDDLGGYSCGSTTIVTGTWYNAEFQHTNDGATGYDNITLWLNGVQEVTRSSVDNQANTSFDIGLFDSDTAQNDVSFDNVSFNWSSSSIVGHNPTEGVYTLQTSSWPSDISFDIDRNGYSQTAGQAFLIRKWKSLSSPAQVLLEDTTQVEATNYNVDVLPISEAWINDSDGVCGTSGWLRIADGGLTTDTDEYLADSSDNVDFGSTSSCTWGDNSSDAVYFARNDQFSGLNILLSTRGAGTAVATWEYCSANTDLATTCDTWSTLSTSETNSGTSNFTGSGNLNFTPPTNWVRSTENSGFQALFFVRARITSGSYSTYPIEAQIKSDILAMQYLGSISSNDQTFTLKVQTPEVARWKMDEGRSTTLNDSTGHNNNLTISGATWQTDPNNQTQRATFLRFDGSNDYAYSGSASAYNFGAGSFTISGWFRHTEAISGTDTIFSKASGVNGVGYKAYMNSSGYICFGIDDTAGSFPSDSACSTVSFADSKWHNITVVKSSTSAIYLYVDGNLMASDASLSSTGFLDSSGVFNLGIDADASSNPFAGDLDDFVVYSYALTSNEVKAAAVLPITSALFGTSVTDSLTDRLIGWWKLEETSTPSLDSSGNGNSGTWGGHTATGSGKFGNGVTMDGNGDYITVSGLTITPSEFTVSFWLNPTTLANFNQNIVATNSWGAFVFHTTSSGEVYVGTDMANRLTPAELPAGTLTTGSWQHFTFTYKAGKGSFYKNGNLLASKTGMQDPTAWGGFSIGVNSANAINGRVDEVRVYTRQLSEGEVKKLYNYAPGPVAYYDFNENSGSSVYDSSGNNVAVGTLEGNTIWTTGKFGSALQLDGTSGYVSFGGDVNALDMGDNTAFTVEAWVYRTSVSQDAEIITKKLGSGTNAGYQIYQWSTANGGNTCLYVADGVDLYETCTADNSTLTLNTWEHIVAVFDNTGYAGSGIYINGVNAEDSAYEIGTISNIGDTSNIYHFCVGTDSNSAGCQSNREFAGKIDDVKIYNYARTPAQIIEDMNGGHPVGGSPIGSQVGYWKFDEGSGTTAYDSSPLANNLTLSTASWVTSGKLNTAFNGEGSRWVSRADDADLDFNATDSFTISGWFRSDNASNPGATEYLVTKSNATTAGYAMYINTSGQACIGIDDDTSWGPDIASCSSADIYDTNWHHILGMRDVTADQTKLFVDGVLVDSDTDPTSATLENSLTFYVADRDGSNNGNEFVGDVDELKIYRTALTDEQVKTEFLAGKSSKLGALSTNSSGVSNDSKDRSYCIPGDSTSCSAPILEWKFDENTGTSANDTSGSGYTGSFGSAPAWTRGKEGSALNFDGADDYVSVASSASIEDLTTLTYEAWIYPTGWGEGNFGRIIDKDDGFNTRNMFVLLNNTGQQSFRFYRGRGSVDTYADAADGSITLNQWQHVAASYDSSSFVRLYVNGQEVPSYTQQTLGSGTLTTEAGVPFVVGNREDQDRSFQGIIDQVRFYNYARTAAQIAWDYNRGAPVAWYRFDECSGTTINNNAPAATGGDSSIDGTLTLGASGTTSAGTCSTSGAWYNGVSGKINSSMDFDGTDDYVTLGDNFDFTGNVPFSLSIWVYPNTNPSAQGQFISKYNAGTSGQWYLGMNGTGNVTFLRECGSYGTSSTQTLALNTWSHITGIYDGTSLIIYINAKPVRVVSDSCSISNTSVNTMLGAGDDGGGIEYPFDGKLDDARVYNYALTQDQVQDVFNNGAVSFK